MAAKKVKPEVIAAISAAVSQVTGGNGKVVAVKIKRNQNWAFVAKTSRH